MRLFQCNLPQSISTVNNTVIRLCDGFGRLIYQIEPIKVMPCEMSLKRGVLESPTVCLIGSQVQTCLDKAAAS